MEQVKTKALIKVLTHPHQLPEGADMLGQPAISFEEALCLPHLVVCCNAMECFCVVLTDQLIATPQLWSVNGLAIKEDRPLGPPEEESQLVAVVAT
jgi:hypothetical protein